MSNQYKQLTQKERYQIQALKELGFSARKIVKALQRSNKTISRELDFAGAKSYCAEEAESLACQKRTQAKKHTKFTQIIKKLVRSMLRIELSPEQISGRMKREAFSNHY